MYIFAKSFQSDGWVQAILNIAFMVILFTVGWTLADLFVGLIVSDQGYILNIKPNSILNNILKISGFYRPLGGDSIKLMPKDTICLLVLTTAEVFFYRFFFSVNKTTTEAK